MTSIDQKCRIPHKCNTLKTALYLIKTSGKLETREVFLEFIPFDPQKLHSPSLVAQKGI